MQSGIFMYNGIIKWRFKGRGVKRVTIDNKVYTCGEIGSLNQIIGLMKKNECSGVYFVYHTKNKNCLMCFGNFNALKKETDPVIVGVAQTYAHAQKIVLHIIKIETLKNRTI